MTRAILKYGAAAITLAALLPAAGLVWHHIQRVRIDHAFQADTGAGLIHWESTRRVSILPLINWHALPGLEAEMGVSYLVRTDRNTILFDLGQNVWGESPSPLQRNMQALGVRLEDIDAIFLSHLHFDHVGGRRWATRATFSLDGKSQPDLGELHVENHGVVLIVGCGHQTLEKILARFDAHFREPLYGIIGDLHYPVPKGRLEILGFDGQRRFASGAGPFTPITREMVETDIQRLRARRPGIVAIGGHDTSDEAIGWFAAEFPESYKYVKVGEWIHLP